MVTPTVFIAGTAYMKWYKLDVLAKVCFTQGLLDIRLLREWCRI